MDVIQRTIQDAIVLDIRGDLTYSNRSAFKLAIEQVKNRGCRHLIVNLEFVRFVDSSGLGLLALVAQSFKLQQTQVSLLRPQSYVREIMSLANLPRMIPIYETEGEALTARAA
ncbi:MAG: STAS domain-containing protein [Nitrospira sp.]|nr:STAS domain-containing protein [Nitrospira sp.]